jgi:hypothetical protein
MPFGLTDHRIWLSLILLTALTVRIVPVLQIRASVMLGSLYVESDPGLTIRLFAAALAIDSGAVDANLGLGAALRHKNDTAAASEAYLRVLRVDPGNSTALIGRGTFRMIQSRTKTPSISAGNRATADARQNTLCCRRDDGNPQRVNPVTATGFAIPGF